MLRYALTRLASVSITQFATFGASPCSVRRSKRVPPMSVSGRASPNVDGSMPSIPGPTSDETGATLADYRPPVITTVYSDDNRKIAEFYKERRIVVPVPVEDRLSFVDTVGNPSHRGPRHPFSLHKDLG